MSPHRENFVALVQARMSSQRLPGKVLRPLAGRAILEHVCAAAAAALSPDQVIVATSTQSSDDEIEHFCKAKGILVHRGSLDNVVERLQGALRKSGATAFFRICTDSPFYDSAAMKQAMEIFESKEFDLVTNVFPRSFPKGRSIELARASTFLSINATKLSKEEQEHVFPLYYENPARFRIENFSAVKDFSEINLCVDTLEDWQRAENFLREHKKAAHLFEPEELAESFRGSGS